MKSGETLEKWGKVGKSWKKWGKSGEKCGKWGKVTKSWKKLEKVGKVGKRAFFKFWTKWPPAAILDVRK